MNNMKISTIQVPALRFPVTLQPDGCSEKINWHIVLTKDQLNAAQMVGQSSKELIERIFSRNGFTVLNIEKPLRKTLEINLETEWWY